MAYPLFPRTYSILDQPDVSRWCWWQSEEPTYLQNILSAKYENNIANISLLLPDWSIGQPPFSVNCTFWIHKPSLILPFCIIQYYRYVGDQVSKFAHSLKAKSVSRRSHQGIEFKMEEYRIILTLLASLSDSLIPSCLNICKCCIMAFSRSLSDCNCNSNWLTTWAWTRVWAVDRSSRQWSVFRCL